MRIVLHEHTTRQHLPASDSSVTGRGTARKRIRSRRSRRNHRSVPLQRQTLEKENQRGRHSGSRTQTQFRAEIVSHAGTIRRTQTNRQGRSRCIGFLQRTLELTTSRQGRCRTVRRRVQCEVHPGTVTQTRFIATDSRRAIAEAVASRHRPLASIYLAARQKKVLDNGYVLIFEDESGFNLFPNVYRTWAEVGQTPILIEPPKRLHHSAIGWIAATAGLSRFRFLFTISPDSVLAEDLIFWLTTLHFHYRNKIVFVWDNLGGHKAVEEYFSLRHPDWFDFVSLPTYSPELNPVESCWKEMKGGDLSNFTAEDTETLTAVTVESAQKN